MIKRYLGQLKGIYRGNWLNGHIWLSDYIEVDARNWRLKSENVGSQSQTRVNEETLKNL